MSTVTASRYVLCSKQRKNYTDLALTHPCPLQKRINLGHTISYHNMIETKRQLDLPLAVTLTPVSHCSLHIRKQYYPIGSSRMKFALEIIRNQLAQKPYKDTASLTWKGEH